MDSTDASASNNTLVSAETADIPVQPEVVEIALDGDVILVIGTSGNMIKLKVHSLCLKLASKAFAAMFGPNWLEDKAVSKDDPKEAALPEDDPAAMRKICQILHQKVDAREGQALTVTELAHLALDADKYDLEQLLSCFSRNWVDNVTLNTTEDRLLCLSAISYFNPGETWDWMFGVVSLDNYCFNDYCEVSLLCNMIDSDIAYRLAEVRTSLRIKLASLVVQKCCDSIYGKLAAPRLEALRKAYTLQKMFAVPAMEIIDKLKTVYNPKRAKDQGYISRKSPENGACRCAYRLFSELDRMHENITSRVKKTMDS